jgi:PQQ-like domain
MGSRGTPASLAPQAHPGAVEGRRCRRTDERPPEGGPLATDGSHIFVLSNDAAHNSCVAAALAPATGRVLWPRRLPSFSFAAPAVAGNRLFASGADVMLRGW